MRYSYTPQTWDDDDTAVEIVSHLPADVTPPKSARKRAQTQPYMFATTMVVLKLT